MARDYAKLRIDIWADEDWSELSEAAQHLYLRLLSHPRLSKCGVTDWHPARLAAKTRGSTAEHITAAGAELADKQFIVVDMDTGEVLIRTHIKHDGIMRSVNGAIGVVNDYADISSPTLQAVVVHELRRLREQLPDLTCWSYTEARAQRVLALLRRPAADPAALASPFASPSPSPSADTYTTPFANTSVTPSPIQKPITTTLDTYSVSKDEQRTRRPEPLPDEWIPDAALAAAMAVECPTVDLQREHRKFMDYYRATGRTMVDWSATWRNWMRRSAERQVADTRPTARERQHAQAGRDFMAARSRETPSAGLGTEPLALLGNPFLTAGPVQ